MEAKANFSEAVSGDHRFNLVVVEDGVKGTASGYNQSNAYAGGANGVMGGYELLPNPVPAARMVYNHVGRAIMDGWAGVAGYLPSDIPANTTYIKAYEYTIPATSVLGNIKLVAMMLDPNGEIINANDVSFDKALANGLFTANDNPQHNSANWFVYSQGSGHAVHLQLENSADVQLHVLDLQGRVLATRQYGEILGTADLPIQSEILTNGNYLVKLVVNGNAQFKKLSVTK